MDETFVKLMMEYIDKSAEDRKDTKEILERNAECLVKIKMQLTRLETQFESSTKSRDERLGECNKKHELINAELKKIPSEKQIESLEKLKPFVYKVSGGLILLAAIAVPLLKITGLI